MPFTADEDADLGQYVEEVVAGFREMYQLLLAKRDTLLAECSPVSALAHAPMRLVFRDTATYFTLLKNSMDASVLRDGADRSVHFEALSRAILVSQSNARFAPFLGAEKQSLSELDIPFFTLLPQSRSLSVAPGETVENCFPESAYERVCKRFEQLGSEDLEEQIGIIRGSFWAKLASRQRTATSSAASQGETESTCRSLTGDIPGLLNPLGRRLPEFIPSSTNLLEEAARLARLLQRKAIRGNDGSVTWLGLVRRPQARNYNFGPVGLGVTDGLAGIALFLAAVENATQSGELRATALGALQPIRRALESYESALRTGRRFLARDVTPGATGLGGVVYALRRVARLLWEDAAMQVAQKAASLIQPELFEAGTSLDVSSGVSGAILGLLSFHEACRDSSVLARAVACGNYIIKRHTDTSEDGSPPASLAGELAADFGRGPCGIGYALMRLYRATREERFLRAAGGLRAAESAEHDSTHGNGFAAPGLFWLASLAVEAHGDLHSKIDGALKRCLATPLDAPDQVANGLAGDWDFLVEASGLTRRPELLEIARKHAGWSITRAQRAGGYWLHAGLPAGILMPGFLEGISGIGYEFLRLAVPEAMPSVLLWN